MLYRQVGEMDKARAEFVEAGRLDPEHYTNAAEVFGK
jgi:hypothetical protein